MSKQKTVKISIFSRERRPDARLISTDSVRRTILKTKYPAAKYSPLPGCQFCGGRGEVRKGKTEKPCICIFVAHEDIPTALAALQNAVNEPEQIEAVKQWAGVQNWKDLR